MLDPLNAKRYFTNDKWMTFHFIQNGLQIHDLKAALISIFRFSYLYFHHSITLLIHTMRHLDQTLSITVIGNRVADHTPVCPRTAGYHSHIANTDHRHTVLGRKISIGFLPSGSIGCLQFLRRHRQEQGDSKSWVPMRPNA